VPGCTVSSPSSIRHNHFSAIVRTVVYLYQGCTFRCLLLDGLRRSPRVTLLPPGRVRPESLHCSTSRTACDLPVHQFGRGLSASSGGTAMLLSCTPLPCTLSPYTALPTAGLALASALPRRRSLRDRPCQGTVVRSHVALRAGLSRAATPHLHPCTPEPCASLARIALLLTRLNPPCAPLLAPGCSPPLGSRSCVRTLALSAPARSAHRPHLLTLPPALLRREPPPHAVPPCASARSLPSRPALLCRAAAAARHQRAFARRAHALAPACASSWARQLA
jgi:hypothetical protein